MVFHQHNRTTLGRLLGVFAVTALSLLGASASASGAERVPEIDVRVACDAPDVPGRVRCEAELRAPEGQRLAWSDVLVVSAPSTARPLRSRVPAQVGKDGVGRAALALVASTTGVFPVVVRGRAAVCAGEDTGAACRAATRDLEVEVRVGSAPKR